MSVLEIVGVLIGSVALLVLIGALAMGGRGVGGGEPYEPPPPPA